jgi:malonyl CoA-acyl carrier protein transacylase
VAIALTTVRQRPALKAVAIHALKRASNLVVNSAASNVASRLAAKVALNLVVISAKMRAVKTVLTLETPAPLAHPVVSTRVAVPAIVLHAVLKSSVLATSSLTMLAVTPHPSALAPRC